MKIPLVDLKAQYDTIRNEIDDAIRSVINNTQFILGPEVAALESEIAAYCQTKFSVGVASGTEALQLALLACGIRPGDEVITTPFTFIATAEAITQCGAVPVFADIDPETYNIEPEKVIGGLLAISGGILADVIGGILLFNGFIVMIDILAIIFTIVGLAMAIMIALTLFLGNL